MNKCIVALSFFVAIAAASLCTTGCNPVPGFCTCYDPFFKCNPDGGQCILDLCEGSCDMAPWFLGSVIGIPLIVTLSCIAGCVYCCCFARRGDNHYYHQLKDPTA
jgi:hypothetical protein